MKRTTGSWGWLLPASFGPFLWKSVTYARIGSYVPLAGFLLLAGLVVWGVTRAGEPGRRRAVRIWCLSMILWGVARLALAVLVRLAELDEAHLIAQFTLGYLLSSLSYVGLGLFLFGHPRTRRSDG